MSGEAGHSWQRLFALGLLIVLLVSLAAGIGWPVWSLNQVYAERIAEQRRMLGQYQRIAAGGQAVQSEVRRLQRWQSSSKLYLHANTEALAGAELQRLVKQQATASGGRVMSTQTLAGERDGAFKRVAVKARLRTDVNGMLHTLHGLESRRPLLFIDNLTIRSLTSRRRDPGSGKLFEAIDLDMTFEISGFMREEAS